MAPMMERVIDALAGLHMLGGWCRVGEAALDAVRSWQQAGRRGLQG